MLDESIGARRIRWQGLKNVDLEGREVATARLTIDKWKSALPWARGTTETLDVDVISSSSRTRPSSSLSFPDIVNAAIRFNQAMTPTDSRQTRFKLQSMISTQNQQQKA